MGSHYSKSPMSSHRLLLLLLTAPLLLLWLGGCSEAPPSGPKKKKQRTPQEHLVEVMGVKRESISTAHERSGTLRARRRVEIHNQEEGRIHELPFYEGDRVTRGQILVRLDDDLLQAVLDKARANTGLARINLKRVRDLIKKRAASEDERARAKTALDVAEAEQKLLQTRLEHTRIKAPFDGVISERKVEPGDVTASYSHLLTLTDPSSLITRIHVSELLLPHLKSGDPVSVRIDALGPSFFPGRIKRIFPELDPVTRQGVVEVSLEPVPDGARAGQFARVTLETARVERMLIPFAAVRRDREGEFVFRLNEKNKALRIPVRSGIRIGDRIEILEGLETEDRIVSRGFLGLSEGKQVTPVNEDL